MAIYYTSSLATVGSGAGTLASPWNIEDAIPALVAGDELRIIADGTYLPSATLTFGSTTPGTEANPIKVIGCNVSGEIDGSKPTISGANMGSLTNILQISANGALYLANVHLTNAQKCALTDDSKKITLAMDNVKISYCSANQNCAGIVLGAYTSSCIMFRCIFDNNYRAVYHASTDRYISLSYVQCVFVNNTVNGAKTESLATSVIGCLFVNNGGTGLLFNKGTMPAIIYNNTFVNCGTGIELIQTTLNRPAFIANNIFYGSTGYAINFKGVSLANVKIENNCFYNNTSGDSDTGTISGNGNIHADPLFTDATNGDYSLQANSPCINAGMQLPEIDT